MINPTDKVLDVGAAYQPFERANVFIDVIRNVEKGSQWVCWDICDHNKPWPFKNKEFDFVVCAQTLEDVRDPLWVCEEMQRVGKRGFIETPSRFYEQTEGLDKPGLSGACHHRWIVTASGSALTFTMKNHNIHLKKYQIRRPWFCKYPYLKPKWEMLTFYWENNFVAREDVLGSIQSQEIFLKETLQMAGKIRDLWI